MKTKQITVDVTAAKQMLCLEYVDLRGTALAVPWACMTTVMTEMAAIYLEGVCQSQRADQSWPQNVST